MYSFLRKGLMALPPETAHNLSLKMLALSPCLLHRFLSPPSGKAKTVMGLSFPNMVGLSAGADKNGEAIDGFAAFGFGFIEVGTVTPKAQPGNPKPRQFRLPEMEGIINRNGFNNLGVDHLIEQVKKAKFKGILGINIGKNKNTPVEKGKEDYLYCLRKAYAYADYIAVNISSPNTPNLRDLQLGDNLEDLLACLKAEQTKLQHIHQKYVPIAVKIAPDLSQEEVNNIALKLQRHKIDGVIATNTTLDRTNVKGIPNATENGGLSGKPLQQKSTQVIKWLYEVLQGEIPIIGCGGVDSLPAAEEKIQAGADLIQLYSGLIYHGPKLVSDLLKGLNN